MTKRSKNNAELCWDTYASFNKHQLYCCCVLFQATTKRFAWSDWSNKRPLTLCGEKLRAGCLYTRNEIRMYCWKVTLQSREYLVQHFHFLLVLLAEVFSFVKSIITFVMYSCCIFQPYCNIWRFSLAVFSPAGIFKELAWLAVWSILLTRVREPLNWLQMMGTVSRNQVFPPSVLAL